MYGPGGGTPMPAAALLDRAGKAIADLPVTPARAGGTHQIDLGMNTLAPGEYLVEITVKGEGGDIQTLVPFRVGT